MVATLCAGSHTIISQEIQIQCMIENTNTIIENTDTNTKIEKIV